MAFLEFVQSEDFDNVEQFLVTLEKFHPDSADAFQREMDEAITLISRGDHFQHFFTDRDGTLKSYSCSYASSIQPSYSGVIQVQPQLTLGDQEELRPIILYSMTAPPVVPRQYFSC